MKEELNIVGTAEGSNIDHRESSIFKKGKLTPE